jgi:signal transduction histidine kinase
MVVLSLMLAGLAVMFTAIWWRSREPGMGLLGTGFMLAALWYYFSDLAPNTGADIDTWPERLAALVIIATILLRTAGIVVYLGAPQGLMRRFIGACALPSILSVPWLLVGLAINHHTFHMIGLLPYLGAAVLAFHRARLEPGDAHALLGLALLTLPVLPFVLPSLGVDANDLKQFTGCTSIAFGMLVLTVSLLRRDANLALEARVQERTAHLRELIGGLEAFNRGVSHDLRGPLGGMSQLAHMASDALGRGDTTLASRALPVIAKQCDASVQMVGSMLDLARLADAPVHCTTVSLRDVVVGAVDEAMLTWPGEARPRIAAGDPLRGWPGVTADPVLLRTALVNLVGNAVKFSRRSTTPLVEIDAHIDGQVVTVSVRDNGPGFPSEDAARLFEPFYRVPGTGEPGHGLGLSLARRAVEAMGGRIEAVRRPEGGAEMRFTLTMASDGTQAQPTTGGPEPQAEVRLGADMTTH